MDLLTGKGGNTLRFHMSYGFAITNRFSAGAGIGYFPYHDPVHLMPVYLDLVYQTRDDGITLYFQLKTGYSFSLFQNHEVEEGRYRGGFNINPGVGIQIWTEDAHGFYLSIAYQILFGLA